MKSSAAKLRENLHDEEKSTDSPVSQEDGSPAVHKNCHKKSLEENEVDNNTNGFVCDFSMKFDNGVHEKTDSIDSNSNDAVRQSTDLGPETVNSESDASEDGSIANGAHDVSRSSSGNEDSCDGFNNNNKIFRTESSPVDEMADDQCPEDRNGAAEINTATNSTNKRKASSRKSQHVKKVVNAEQGGESDYYDSDLEEYLTPIKTKVDKKQDDSLEKRRKSKRKRKLQLNIDEDSDFFCIENFLNSNPDEQQQLLQSPKEKKKKKKVDGLDPSVPASPNTPKTMQNVKLNLPNGMTRVVSLELPSPGSDSNSMLCSLLTGKRYSSPGKGGKLKLITKDTSSSSQAGRAGDHVKKVRFSEQDLCNNMVPKTVDDHCVSNKEERSGGNVPLILENLLTSPHINQSCSLPDKVPAVVENEVLDLSNPDSDWLENTHGGTSAQECIPNQAMQKLLKGNSSKSYNLKKKMTLDGSSHMKEGDSSEKGFSKTLLSYLTSGKSSTASDAQPIDVEQQHELGGIRVVLSGNTLTTATENPAAGITSNKAKENIRIKSNQQSARTFSGQNMYYAKSEYIDLNELYCLQKGKRPIFEIEDSDDDNDVIIIGDGDSSKSSLKLESPKQKGAIIPSALSQKRSSPVLGVSKSPHPALPDLNASVLKESTSSKHNKSPGTSTTKTKVKMNNSKQIPLVKDAVDHNMKDGVIESISFKVSKLDAKSTSKPVQLKSLIAKQKSKGGHKKLSAPPQESPKQLSVKEKTKTDKATVSIIKSKTPTSKSQGNGTNNRVYNSLLTGNSYVMKTPGQAVPLPGKKTKV